MDSGLNLSQDNLEISQDLYDNVMSYLQLSNDKRKVLKDKLRLQQKVTMDMTMVSVKLGHQVKRLEDQLRETRIQLTQEFRDQQLQISKHEDAVRQSQRADRGGAGVGGAVRVGPKHEEVE